MTKRIVPGGFYLSFDGVDGCGKGTQIRLLEQRLGKEFLLYSGREPGSTSVAEKVRNVLLDKNLNMDDTTELFLYNAARADLFEKQVLPALNQGKVVVMDRSFDSTTAYQGHAGNQDLNLIEEFAMVATKNKKPDLTFILDIDLETRAKRLYGVIPDRLEAKDAAYQQKVIEGYRSIAAAEPNRCVLLSGTRTREDLHEEIYTTTKQRIEEALGRR